MNGRILLFLLLIFLLSDCLRDEFSPLEFIEITTIETSVEELNAVRLVGQVEGLMGPSLLDIGFLISTTDDDPKLDAPEVIVISLGPTEKNGDFDTLWRASSIAPLYQARAYGLTAENKTFYGEVFSFAFSFRVWSGEGENVIVKNDTAWVEGFISGVSNNDKPVAEFGHVYSETNSMPTVEDDSVLLGSLEKDRTFLTKLTNLNFNSRYYARAFAKVENEYIYSNEVTTFRTKGGWRLVYSDTPDSSYASSISTGFKIGRNGYIYTLEAPSDQMKFLKFKTDALDSGNDLIEPIG